MLGSLWTGLGGKLAERWAAAIFSPAFAFWIGGLAAYLDGRGGSLTSEAERGSADIADLPAATQGAVVVGALLLVAISGLLVQAITLPVLRMLEGYWASPVEGVRRWLVRRRSARLDREAERWRELALKDAAGRLEPGEAGEYARLDRHRRQTPPRAEERMPTRLGDVLRAAESRPARRYGLDAIVCWTPLWLLMPEGAQREVTASRRVLDLRGEIWVWGVLFVLWTPLAWWALPIGIAVAIGAYRALLGAADAYGSLIVSCFDLYRGLLYEALRLPLPSTPAVEQAHGEALTQYLSRGALPEGAAFRDLAPESSVGAGAHD
jgi:hypothetical protein